MNEHPLNALPKGYRLQEHEFVRVLGFGGFGVTYLGYDHNLDKAVAIKEYQPADIAIRTENQSIAPKASTFREDFDWGLERFLDEARTLARFDHRNIVKVHRYFEANGTAYIVMEYAEGETLTAYFSRKRTLDEAELKRVLIPILDGLETIHGADFLHRDIKPSNIVLRDEDSSPVLLDFGAARHAVGARSRSVTTIVTPAYAPIEQYSSRGNQGPWTDIYALGAVCYKALTGETPADAIDRLEHDPLEPVTKRCSDKGGRGFLKAIDWALNVREGDRPQTIAAWKSAVLIAEPMPAKEIPTPKSDLQPPGTQRKLSRSHWIVVILFLSVVTSGIVIAIQQELEQRSEEARRIAAVEAREARRASVEAFRQSQARAAEEAKRAAVEAERQRRARAAEEVRRAAAEAERERQARAEEEARRATAEVERERQARGRQTTRANFITLGTHKDDVLRLQGTPSSIETRSTIEILHYGLNKIRVDRRTKQVTQWDNFTGALKVRLQPGSQTTRANFITLGTHKDDVLRLQGTPSSIETRSTIEILHYGLNKIRVDRRTKQVTQWDNFTGALKVRLQPGSQTTRANFITLGTHKDDVLRLQGTPSSIETRSAIEILHYGLNKIRVDRRTKQVTQWDNFTGALKVRLQPGSQTTRANFITLGTHKDDVLRLQGTPSSIETRSTIEILHYGLNKIRVDRRTKQVTQWDNFTGALKVRLLPGN